MNPCPALALFSLVAASVPLFSDWSLESEILDEGCTGGTPSVPGDPPRLVFDRPQEDPQGFSRLRTTTAALPEGFIAAGLAPLRASGSGQFTAAGLAAMVGVLQQQHGAPARARITLVDLRNEPHGHAGVQAVSWHAWNNWLNKELPPAAAWADERARLTELEAQTGSSVPAFRVCKARTPEGKKVASYHADSLAVQSVVAEQAVVQGAGMQYLRFPMVDHSGAPSDAVVEAFLAAVAQRPADSWWHFHCRKGQGRTTLFMAMLDMMHNARGLPLSAIAARQTAINQVDILARSRHAPEKSAQRRAFVQAFYAYCQAGMPGPWHAWPREVPAM